MRQKKQKHTGCPQWVLERIRAIREQATTNGLEIKPTPEVSHERK